MRRQIVAIAGAATLWGGAAQAAGTPVSFLACPVFRDIAIGRGCWMTRHEGRLYFIGRRGRAAVSVPPQLGHQILVEGVLSDGPDKCGGAPLDGVTISVIKELSPRCNEVIPAEGHASLPAIDAEYTDKARIPFGRLPLKAQPLDGVRKATITFEFDNDFLDAPVRGAVEQAGLYAAAYDAEVELVGYRTASGLTGGKVLRESADIGERRARMVAEAFRRLGVAPERISTRWIDEPEARDGLKAPLSRRVEMTITPAGF